VPSICPRGCALRLYDACATCGLHRITAKHNYNIWERAESWRCRYLTTFHAFSRREATTATSQTLCDILQKAVTGCFVNLQAMSGHDEHQGSSESIAGACSKIIRAAARKGLAKMCSACQVLEYCTLSTRRRSLADVLRVVPCCHARLKCRNLNLREDATVLSLRGILTPVVAFNPT